MISRGCQRMQPQVVLAKRRIEPCKKQLIEKERRLWYTDGRKHPGQFPVGGH